MALYVPTIQTHLMLRNLFESPLWANIVASGIIDFEDLNDLVKEGGDFVHIPRTNVAADLVFQDITSTTPVSPTAMASTDDLAVIMRAFSLNYFTQTDLKRTAAQLDKQLSESFGDKLAKRMQTILGFIVKGALDGQASGDAANSHVINLSNAPITFNSLLDAKYTLASSADFIDTIVINAKVKRDLLYDLSTNYKVWNVAGSTILNGALAEIAGIKKMCISDLLYSYSDGSSADTRYETLLAGPKAFSCAFQQEPLVESWDNVTTPSTIMNVKLSTAFVTHLKTIAYGGALNPNDAAVVNGPWTVAYQDPRQLLAAKIVSNGGVYASA